MIGVLPKRGIDGAGNGAFGASRKRDGKTYTHRAQDYNGTKGMGVLSPVFGTVTKYGYLYKDDLKWRYVQITNSDDLNFRHGYCLMPDNLAIGDKVCIGDVIGIMQAISEKYPKSSDHLHLEVKNADGNYLDPNDFV